MDLCQSPLRCTMISSTTRAAFMCTRDSRRSSIPSRSRTMRCSWLVMVWMQPLVLSSGRWRTRGGHSGGRTATSGSGGVPMSAPLKALQYSHSHSIKYSHSENNYIRNSYEFLKNNVDLLFSQSQGLLLKDFSHLICTSTCIYNVHFALFLMWNW